MELLDTVVAPFVLGLDVKELTPKPLDVPFILLYALQCRELFEQSFDLAPTFLVRLLFALLPRRNQLAQVSHRSQANHVETPAHETHRAQVLQIEVVRDALHVLEAEVVEYGEGDLLVAKLALDESEAELLVPSGE